MKYKVGDRVRIRTDLIINNPYGKCCFIKEMDKYKGVEATINCILDNIYLLNIDNGKFLWTDDMLELAYEFKVGDMVKIIDAGYGARGCNGKIGVVSDKEANNGNVGLPNTFNVQIAYKDCNIDKIWSVNKDGKYELLKNGEIYNIIEALNMPEGTILKCLETEQLFKIRKLSFKNYMFNLNNLNGQYKYNGDTIKYNFLKVSVKTDWSKVAIGTKVQVRNENDEKWLNRYYVEQDSNGCFIASILFSEDYYTGETALSTSSSYKQCRLHPDIDVNKEWITYV